MNRVFSLDALPIGFPTRTTNDPTNHQNLRRSAHRLTDRFLQPTGHRFWQQSVSICTYKYSCCQDEDHKASRHVALGKRKRKQVERFHCDSSLSLEIDFNMRIVNLKFKHKFHRPHPHGCPSADIGASNDHVEGVKDIGRDSKDANGPDNSSAQDAQDEIRKEREEFLEGFRVLTERYGYELEKGNLEYCDSVRREFSWVKDLDDDIRSLNGRWPDPKGTYKHPATKYYWPASYQPSAKSHQP